MYLHLGQDTIVNERDIVGVFDFGQLHRLPAHPGFPLQGPEGGPGGQRLYGVAQVLCGVPGRDGRTTVYISQISTATLLRRASSLVGGW